MGHAVNTYADVSSQGPQCSPGYFSLHKRFTVEGTIIHLLICLFKVVMCSCSKFKRAKKQVYKDSILGLGKGSSSKALATQA